ncbi:MAG: S8 family serine peptidase [Rhodospirillales bacterium]|nr:S8 family serine peptidase [Rhodospirillales bacterium]
MTRAALPSPEFEALVEEIAGEYAEPSSFQNQWGLAAINADQAYANLELEFGTDVAPGEGVAVGILDTGIDGADPAFRDKTVIERFLPDATDEDGSKFSHGTAVASILAGENIPGFPHDSQGVAWGADLVVFAIPLGSAPELHDPIQISQLPGTGEYFAETFEEILAWRFGTRSIDSLNLSLGVTGIIENYSEEVVRDPFAPLLPVILQERADEKVVFVWAAGNSHGRMCDIPITQCVDGAVEASSIDLLPGLAVHFPELQETTVAVVAVAPDSDGDGDYEIADFSNRCGIAADYCLAAPGAEVLVSYFGPDADGNPIRSVATGGGTSFAAPMVTGGLAVMKQYFRGQVSNTDLLSRLLKTANRSGIYADAAIYGRGLMDLGAATSPVGAPVVTMGARVGSSGAALSGSTLQLGLAFGDALAPALADREIAAFNQLGAPFWYDADTMVSVAARPALHDRFRDFQQLSLLEPLGAPASAIRLPILDSPDGSHDAVPALYLARAGAPAAANANHFALAGHSVVATLPVAANLSATLLTTEGLARQEPASGAALVWRAPEAPIGLRAGWMGERQTLLGSESDGAFGDLVAHAAFAGIEADTELGSWRLGGTAEIGTVNAQAHGGVFQEISSLATSAFALHATRQNEDGSAFRVSLSQPLRVEEGQALLTLPSGRTTSGEVIRSTLTADVEPGGRQVDLALHWQQPLEIGALRLGATVSHEPGHRRNADAELILLSGWRHLF